MADPIETKTYVTGEVLDAPDMNNYQRDNWDYIRPKTVKASGKQAFTMNAGNGTTTPSAAGGTNNFGVTFTAAPLVFMQIEIGGNFDSAINLVTVSTTQFQWRAFTRDPATSTPSGSFHWIAIGTVA